ncbi:hypothetical protein Tco_0412639 [Tanacetum coccineum]
MCTFWRTRSLCAIGKGCKNLKSLSDCYFLSDMGLEAVAAVLNMHILKLMFAIILTHTGLKASEDLAFGPGLKAVDEFYQKVSNKASIKNVCRPLLCIQVKMAMLIMLSLCLIAYINASSNGDEYLVFDKAERAVCTSVDEAKVVELDFLYPSEGIHHRWESGYRITSMATTHDQAVTSRLADSIYR